MIIPDGVPVVVQGQTPGAREYMARLETWFGEEMAWLCSSGCPVDHSRSSGAAMGNRSTKLLGCFPVWGQRYLERFRDVFLASALSGDNLEVVRPAACLVVWTSWEDLAWVQDTCRRLQLERGVHSLVRVIPDQIVQHASTSQANRYPLLGACQQLGVQMSGRWGRDLMPTLPDQLYSDHYFRNLLRVTASGEWGAVVQNALSVSQEAIAPHLDQIRHCDGSLSLSSAQIGDLALACTHPQMSTGLMNGAQSFPAHHFLHWRGRDFCQVCYINAQPTWMSAALCLSTQVSLWGTLDGQVPGLLGSSRVLVPNEEDGLEYLEVSSHEKADDPRRLSLEEFSALAWDVVGGQERYLPWLGVPYRFRCSPVGSGYMEDQAIQAEHQWVASEVALRWERSRDLTLLGRIRGAKRASMGQQDAELQQ